MADLVRQNAWSITLLGLAALMLALWAWPRMKSARAPARWLGRAGARRDPVADVRRDAEELARLLAAELDAKAARLESLIRKADDRLSALEQAAAEGLLDSPADAVAAAAGGAREAQSAGANQRAARAIGAGATDAPSLESDPVARRVCELADAGKTAREIALSLGEHVGKVQLILALRG